MRHRPGVGQKPEPAEWIDLLICGDGRFRHRFPADPVVTVASGDEIAVNPVRDAILHIGDIGRRALEIMNGDIRRLINGIASGGVANITQILVTSVWP